METCRKNYSKKECLERTRKIEEGIRKEREEDADQYLKEIKELATDERYFKEIKEIVKGFRKKYGEEIVNLYLRSEIKTLDDYRKELEKIENPEYEPKGCEELLLHAHEQTRRGMTSLMAVVLEKRFKKKKN